MRINVLFSLLHFPWSGNSQCLWGGSFQYLWTPLKPSGFVTATSALPSDAEMCWEQSPLLLVAWAAALAFVFLGALRTASSVNKDAWEAYSFKWLLGNIYAFAAGWLTVWVNGHNSTGAGWCVVLGCLREGPIHWLGGTSHVQYSPQVMNVS